MNEDQKMGSAQPNGADSVDQGGADQSQSQNVEAKDAGQKEGSLDKKPGRGESRLLGEVKSLKQKLAELRASNEKLEMQKLEVEGNKDKMIEHLQQKVQSLDELIKKKERDFAFATLGSQVKTEAAKMGCQDPDDLIKLMDIDSIPVDPSTYQGDKDAIKMLLEEQKKARPFFFTKSAPVVHDVNKTSVVLNNPSKDLSKMTREELNNLVSELSHEKIL